MEEFANNRHGFTATRHRPEVGTSYFAAIASVFSAGANSATAMAEPTERHQC